LLQETQKFQENVELEFKTKANPNGGELTRDDRKNLGIALSALSNSMGGVLIWGILAAKNDDGIDCASELQPISEIDKFSSEVERAVSQALMPRHEGIRIERISQGANPGAGYLAVYVERSERRPHRCEFGEKQYFKRIGDSSVAMEHYDIEESFKRVVAPALEAQYVLSDGGRRSSPESVSRTARISISLYNCSTVSARFPYLIVEKTSRIKMPFTVHRGIQQPRGAFYGGADDVVHPSLAIHALDVEFEFTVEHRSGVDYLPRGRLSPNLEVSYRCGCLNSRPKWGKFTIEEEEVVGALLLERA
jgi:hypothetical protein